MIKVLRMVPWWLWVGGAVVAVIALRRRAVESNVFHGEGGVVAPLGEDSP